MRLVGREAEFQLLDQALSETQKGRTNVVLLSGGPGIGKTAILRALSEVIEKQTFCEIHSDYKLGSIDYRGTLCSRLLTDCSGSNDCETFTDGRNLARDVVDQLVPSRSSDVVHEGDRTDFSEIRNRLIAAARLRPFVIILDDIHYIDEASLQLVSHLSAALHDVPVCIIAAYRPLEMEKVSPRSAFETIRRRALNLELGSLSAAATGELLNGAPFKIGAEQLEALRKLTGGNPKLILEYQAGVNLEGAPAQPYTVSPVTAGLSTAINELLQGLSPADRSLLSCAAVIGESFEQELAIKLAEVDRSEALKAFSQLEMRGLIRPSSPGQFEFNPGLLRGVLYYGMPPDLRSSYHHRSAVILKGMSAQGTEDLGERVARHFLGSREPEAVKDALEHALLAGRRFLRSGKYAKACEMFALAVEASRRCGSDDEERTCEQLTEYAVALREKGDSAKAEEIFCEAVAIAERLGEPQRICELALKVPDYHWPLPGSGSSLAVLLCERALTLVDNPALKARLASRLAGELSYDPAQKQRSSELIEFSMATASQGGDPELRLYVLRFRDCVLRHSDSIEERLANATEMSKLAREMGDNVSLWEASIARAVSLLVVGSLNEAERELQIVEQTTKMIQRPVYRVLHLVSQASRAAFFGGFDESERLFELARRAATDAEVHGLLGCCWPALALSYAEGERLLELESMANEARGYSESLALQALRCWLNARLGRKFEARTQFHHLAANDFAELRASADFLAGATALASACLKIGNLSRYSARLYDLLLPYADQHAVFGQIAYLGSVSLFLGQLANALSNRDDAIRHFQAASQRHLQMEARPWSLYAAYELAGTLLKDENRERRQHAAAILSQIKIEAGSRGMGFLVKRVAALGAGNENPLPAVFNGESMIGDGLQVCATAESETKSGSVSAGVFRKADRYWTMIYEGHSVRIKDRRGLEWISLLMSKPHESIHVSMLVGEIDGLQGTSDDPLEGFAPSDLGAVIDPEAKRSYQARARELRQELNEASLNNDLGRVEALEQELRFLTRELARAVGLYGRNRASLSSNERARLRVTNAVRSAISAVSVHHAALGKHLADSVKTGLYCSYRPSADSMVAWEL